MKKLLLVLFLFVLSSLYLVTNKRRHTQMTLEARYQHAKDTPSDINEHMETLYELAKQCSSVLELGVRTCVSSWAFLKGLRDNGLGAQKLISNDLQDHPNVEHVKKTAMASGVEYRFIKGNDLFINTEPVDMTFIDTWHIYGQLKRELAIYAPKTRKYIVMHDTEVDGDLGESIRCGWNTYFQSKETGIPEEEIRKGLKPAIVEFLEANPEWRLGLVKTNNNGLTVLVRSTPCSF